MLQCEFQQLLNAYHDGELDEPARRKVEAHARTCEGCAAQLEAMRQLSGLIRSGARAAIDGPRPEELARMHGAVSRAAREARERPLLRIAGGLSAVAASVLIISGVWLVELRGRGAISGGGTSSSPQAQQTGQVATEFPKVWEQVATGRYVPPIFLGNDQGYEPAEPGLAYNNRQLANEIYEGLSR